MSAPNSEIEPPLYVSVPKVYPRVVKGIFRTIKTRLGVILLTLTTIIPFIRWDRGPGMPHQAVMFSFADMKLFFFDTIIWAQEFYFLTAILIASALALFLATSLFGRVWCGMACPQTVWSDLFVFLERIAEGDRNARMKLDKEPWSGRKLLIKTYKQSLWVLASAMTGLVFLGYFIDIIDAAKDMLTGEASAAVYGFWAMFAGGTYAMAGYVKDQMCTYMCPWPRIQGGMLDEQTIQVTYDTARGEKRANFKRGGSFEGRGHCVDCKMCVQACPMGIDIRDGVQMECINCGLCVDACNTVMKRFDLPPNLVGWRANVANPKIMRPRTLIYIALIALVLIGASVAGLNRSEMHLSVLGDRSPSSVRLSGGVISNGYTVKLVNREHKSVSGKLVVTGLTGARLCLLGGPQDQSSLDLTAEPDTVTTFRVFIHQDGKDTQQGNSPVLFSFQDGLAQAKSVFLVE